MSVKVAVGAKSERISKQVLLPFTINGESFDQSCLVIPKLNQALILGCDWLRREKVVLDFEKLSICIGSKNMNLDVKWETMDDKHVSITLCQSEPVQNIEPPHTPERHRYSQEELRDAATKAESFDSRYKLKLYELLGRFSEVFSETPGLTHQYEHEIRLRDEQPFFKNPYPVPMCYRSEARKQINEMVDMGIIEPAQTEFVSPLTIVTKKDKSIRICLDARFLNKRMVKDHIIPPRIEELLGRFSQGLWLSTLDMTSSYYQIPIKREHRKYTGFMFENNSYVFKVLPFGLSTSVASFIRCLDKVLGLEVQGFTLVYVDDILVFSRTADEHLMHLENVFSKFREANLTIKLRKSAFGRKEVMFVGYVVTSEGISIDPSRVTAIEEMSAPRNVRELRGFLGMINYDRRFCENFADLTAPLLHLLKKGIKWQWGVQEDEAFGKIKKAYLEATMVAHIDFEKRFYIQADSSSFGLGSCLYQMSEDGSRNVIAYGSRTLHGAELRYTVTEKEALAIVHALQKWRVFVLGKPLTIVTDHKALSYLLSAPMKTARLTRWALYVQEFDPEILYCKASENVVADRLSRSPIPVKATVRVEAAIHVDSFMLKFTKEFKLMKEDLNAISRDQRKDTLFGSIIANLNRNVDSSYSKNYVLYNGILFKRGDDYNPGYKLCVPKDQALSLIKQQHNDIGHFGYKKTFYHMRQKFYWKKMLKHIRQVVSSCDICQKTKVSRVVRGEFNSVLVKQPGDLVTLDLMGPLPRSRAGATQLLVVVDSFSRYSKLYPLKRATARIIVNRLVNDYFPKVQLAKAVLSDNGTQFHSALYKSTLEERGVQIRYTSLYFPQGNATERVNREIGRLLRVFCAEKHTKWAYLISDVEHCLNSVIHEATGYAPSFLFKGIIENNNIEQVIGFPEEPDLAADTLQRSWEIAYRRMLTKREKKREKYEKVNKPVVLEEGDMVLVKTHPQSSALRAEIKKLFFIFEGPYRVLERKGSNAYLLVDDHGNTVGPHNIINLKKYQSPPPVLQ